MQIQFRWAQIAKALAAAHERGGGELILAVERDPERAGADEFKLVPLTIEDLFERLQKYSEQRNG